MGGKRIIYRQWDEVAGRETTRILIPAPGVPERDVLRAVPSHVVYWIVDASEVPADRTFRDAWNADLTVDMALARDIHRDRLRAARAPVLAALDVEQLRGGDVEARKQALRDVTKDERIEAARTPEELLAVGLPQ